MPLARHADKPAEPALVPAYSAGAGATVVSGTGGNYEKIETGATAIADIADTIDTVYAKISMVGTGSVNEGGNLTYKVEVGEKTVVNPTITADGKLQAVFGKEQATMFELAGIIGKHLS